MSDFKNFYNEHLDIITEKYNREILKELEGKHNISEFAGILIGYNSNYLTDVLNSYTSWLFENFDIQPKS